VIDWHSWSSGNLKFQIDRAMLGDVGTRPPCGFGSYSISSPLFIAEIVRCNRSM